MSAVRALRELPLAGGAGGAARWRRQLEEREDNHHRTNVDEEQGHHFHYSEDQASVISTCRPDSERHGLREKEEKGNTSTLFTASLYPRSY